MHFPFELIVHVVLRIRAAVIIVVKMLVWVQIILWIDSKGLKSIFFIYGFTITVESKSFVGQVLDLQ